MQVFGRLTVDSVEGSRAHCTCACGTKRIVSIYSLRSGNTRSCGCLARERTDKHRRFIDAGGVQQYARYAGGAYTVREGSFSAPTEGAIARNVLAVPHRDPDQKPARDFAARHDLPTHPALMPVKLAEHFVRFLSEVGDLIVDPFGGWATTGRGAELNDRRWLVTERCREYLIAAAQRFRGAPGFNAAFAASNGGLHGGY